MVVSDDQVDAQLSSCLRGSKCADAHVHANDEPDTRPCGARDYVVPHVIAVANAVGDMKIGRASA